MVRPVVLEFGHDDARDYHANEHDDGAGVEHGLSAKLIDQQLGT